MYLFIILNCMSFSSESLDRIKKLERIRALGVNPFATRFDVNSSTHSVNLLPETGTREIEDIIAKPNSTIRVAGRVMLHRSFGKICFATLSDGTGKIQVLFSRENCQIVVDGIPKTELPEAGGEPLSAYKFAEKLIDLGDFIGIEGEMFFTHKGERSIFAEKFTFLTKAIRPLPEKFHGIENDDERYRKRYLDMAMDDELRAMFYRKAKFWEVTRNFLKEK